MEEKVYLIFPREEEGGYKRFYNYRNQRDIDTWEGYKENNKSKFNFEEDHKVELAKAVAENDAVRVKALLDQHGGIDLVDIKGNTLLHFAIRCTHRSGSVIDVLLDTDGVALDACGGHQRTPLLHSLTFRRQSLALKLIERGADIHCRDFMGYSTLHYAVKRKFRRTCLLLIERGVDINCQDESGDTPLIVASWRYCNWIEGIQMLLDKGADANISNKKGNYPYRRATLEAREILVDYVHDKYKTLLHLRDVDTAVYNKSRLLRVWLEYVTEILCDESSIDPGSFALLLTMLPRCFKVFLAKFESVVRFVIEHYSGVGLCFIAQMSSRFSDVENIKNIIENVITLLKSRLCSDFFQYCINGVSPEKGIYCFWSRRYYSISSMFTNFEKLDIDGKEKLMKLISSLVTKGVSYNASDVDTVYLKLGYCSLFKQMIAMEFDVQQCKDRKKVLMPELIYNVQMSLETFFDGTNYLAYFSDSLHLVVDHFCDRRLKEFCSKLKSDRTDNKLMKLPKVPLLLELSRNVARKYIIDSYQIQNFPHFVETLDKYFVAKAYKQILTYERELYGFL